MSTASRQRTREPADGPSKSQPEKPASRLERIKPLIPYALAIACLFQLGLLAGAFSAWRNYVPPPQTVIVQREFVASLVDVREVSIERADDLIRERTYDRALRVYMNLGGGTVDKLPPTLQYRAALCGEGVGRWDDSLNAYRTLSTHPNRLVAAAAQLGQARVWLRQGQATEAVKLLCDLILRAQEFGISSEPMHEDAHHLLGLALSFQAAPPESASSTIVSGVVARVIADWPLDRALRWVPLKETAPEMMPPMPDSEQIQVRGGVIGASRISGAERGVAILDLFQQLATQRKWELAIGDSARRLLADRRIDVAVQRLPMTTFLNCLCQSFEVSWELSADNEFRIQHFSDFSNEEQQSRRLAMATSALDGAMLEYPENPMASQTRLELANHALLAGRLDDALARYAPLIAPSSSNASVMAAYNSGLALRRQGKYERAREAFFRVADGAPAHPLVEYAHFAIARMFVDHGEAEQALPHFHRAFVASTSPQRKAEVLVNMALAEIVLGRYHRAGAVLFDNRMVINNSSSKNLAAFLVSYSRYRTLPIKAEVRREAMYMMRALMALGNDTRKLGRAGVLIVGRGYQELALGELMADLYNEALSEPYTGQITAEMEYYLTSYLYERGSSEAAVERFHKLAASPANGVWAVKSKLQIAEHAYQNQRDDECIATCRDLLTETAHVEIPAVLRLMAQAYEQSGRFREASFCYAGQLPPTGPAITPTPESETP